VKETVLACRLDAKDFCHGQDDFSLEVGSATGGDSPLVQCLGLHIGFNFVQVLLRILEVGIETQRFL
jgi:hypothetical protein